MQKSKDAVTKPVIKTLGVRGARAGTAFHPLLDTLTQTIEQFFDLKGFTGYGSQHDAGKWHKHILCLGENMHTVSQRKEAKRRS